MQHLQPNSTLQGGKYQIIHFLSSGGFGNTYEGVHTMMDTRVAIKEFFPKMFCNRDENTSHVTVATQGNRELVDKLRKKFNEEAKVVFQMKHDNIVRVLDIFEENGTAYYVMEYIDGKSLNEITKERGALPETEAVGYIRQVADALKYVHSLNRLHLDIKPGNIMVDKHGKAILIDFGASKHYDDESGENTSTLMGVNTKGYAPIEQSTQSFTSFSPATDIYALGATLYKLLTGITPPDACLLMAKEDTLKPLPSSISPCIRNAVMEAMALVRSERLQSVDTFSCLLNRNILTEVDIESTICELEDLKITDSHKTHADKTNSIPKESYVIIHRLPELRKGMNLEVYKNGTILSDVNGWSDAKIPIESDAVLYIKLRGKNFVSSSVTARVSKGTDTHLFLWGESWNKLNALKCESKDFVEYLQLRESMVKKSQRNALLNVIIFTSTMIFTFPYIIYKSNKIRKSNMDI